MREAASGSLFLLGRERRFVKAALVAIVWDFSSRKSTFVRSQVTRCVKSFSCLRNNVISN